MFSFRRPCICELYGKYNNLLYLDGKKKQDSFSCPFFVFPYILATLDECLFLNEKGTLWKIDLYNSVIQAVEKAFHLAWK